MIDLCYVNKVKGYPTMLMYENGNKLEEYLGKRHLDDLKKFIKKYDKSTAGSIVEVEEESRPVVNTGGQVLSIQDATTFTETLRQGPAFVKFFAPWCGHCKILKPIWVKLAHDLKNKVTVAEVDCEAQSSLCAAYKIQGYPTLIYFSRNIQTEYTGGRQLNQLRAFAEKAAEGSLHPLHDDSELAEHVREHSVVYLFLYSATNGDIIVCHLYMFTNGYSSIHRKPLVRLQNHCLALRPSILHTLRNYLLATVSLPQPLGLS